MIKSIDNYKSLMLEVINRVQKYQLIKLTMLKKELIKCVK